MAERATYRFGPLERRGLLGPVRAGQALTLAGGGLMAILVLDRAPTAAGAFLATLLFAAAVAVATLPVGRRSIEEWAPVVLAFLLRRTGRRTRSGSQAPTAGARFPLSGTRRGRVAPGQPGLPPALRGTQILDVEHQGRAIGVISSERGRRLTGILACRAIAFALLDPAAQERRLARWGLVLSGAAGTAIRRLQWIERTAPAQGNELARWLHDERDPAIPLRGVPQIDSYLELIGSSTSVAQEHEILLAVQIDAHRVRKRGAQAPLRSLVEHADHVARGLEAGEVTVLGALGPGQITRVLRTAFDPYAGAELTALDAAGTSPDELPESSSWPLAAREAWDHYRSDGALHATFWIGSWPRMEVSAMFMDALLGRSGAVRTVAVTFEPIPPQRSTRDVEAAITRDQADHELRRRFGQSHTARRRQSEEATLLREAELAAGHGEVRLSGFVTVSGRDPEELSRSCAAVADQAARARLELHRMYGQQAEAFTFTLPLCRGLR